MCVRLNGLRNKALPDPKSDYDAMIAATALEHSLIVVTRNVGDFEGMGVELFNPWF